MEIHSSDMKRRSWAKRIAEPKGFDMIWNGETGPRAETEGNGVNSKFVEQKRQGEASNRMAQWRKEMK